RAGRKGTAISLIEAHDYPLFGKVSRYIEDPIKMRVIDSLRPSTKAPSESMMNKPKPSKKVLAKRKEKKKKEEESKKKTKVRHRDKKNIGKRRKPNSSSTAPTRDNAE
ncbi:TPA: hypothetical protein ACKR4E_006810, partial [Pseudomonas aeruginosa]